MTDPLDQQVVDWLKTELAKINEASGFRTTLTADRIFTDEYQIPDDGEQIVFIDDGEETGVETRRPGRIGDLAFSINAVTPAVDGNGESVNPRKKLRQLFADIRTILAPFTTEVDALDGVPKGVLSITFGGRSIPLGDPGGKNLSGEFRLTARIREKHDA